MVLRDIIARGHRIGGWLAVSCVVLSNGIIVLVWIQHQMEMPLEIFHIACSYIGVLLLEDDRVTKVLDSRIHKATITLCHLQGLVLRKRKIDTLLHSFDPTLVYSNLSWCRNQKVNQRLENMSNEGLLTDWWHEYLAPVVGEYLQDKTLGGEGSTFFDMVTSRGWHWLV